jgi:hypothetical protein
MPEKHLLCRDRLRRVPEQFSWVDQRLIRLEYIRRCDCRGWALYLLLVTVADAQGLSYYSDRKTAELLSLNPGEVIEARRQLLAAGMIAYERPLYQVLALGGRS